MSRLLFAVGVLCIAALYGCSATPKYHDPTTKASDPGGVSLSPTKLQVFKNEFASAGPPRRPLPIPDDLLDEHLRLGDSRAAVVIRTEPALLIAAYTDELDCVVMLRFDPAFVSSYGLTEGSRLLTINTYARETVAADLHPGPKNFRRYTNVYPLIAEFLSDDMYRISRRKGSISEDEWRRTWEQGKSYLERYGRLARDGSPYLSAVPARE